MVNLYCRDNQRRGVFHLLGQRRILLLDADFSIYIAQKKEYAVQDPFFAFGKRSIDITKRFYGLASLFSLILGMCIYLFFRDLNNMILFRFIPKPQFTENVIIPLKLSIFSYVLKFNFPYMLWFLSGIFLMRFIWFFNYKVQKIYVFCLYGVGFCYVFCKVSDKFPGTFDWLDLLFMCIGAFAESLLYKRFTLRSYV